MNILHIHNKAQPYNALLVLLYKKDKWTFYSINNHNSPTENHVFYNIFSYLILCTARIIKKRNGRVHFVTRTDALKLYLEELILYVPLR